MARHALPRQQIFCDSEIIAKKKTRTKMSGVVIILQLHARRSCSLGNYFTITKGMVADSFPNWNLTEYEPATRAADSIAIELVPTDLNSFAEKTALPSMS